MTRGHEAKWLVKTLPPAMQGVGISLEATVLPCLGRAALVRCKGPRVAKTDLQRAGKAIREAYARRGDVEIVAEAVLGVIRGDHFHGCRRGAAACRPRRAAGAHVGQSGEFCQDAVARLLKYKKGVVPATAVGKGTTSKGGDPSHASAKPHLRAEHDIRPSSRRRKRERRGAAGRAFVGCRDRPRREDNKPRAFQELSRGNASTRAAVVEHGSPAAPAPEPRTHAAIGRRTQKCRALRAPRWALVAAICNGMKAAPMSPDGGDVEETIMSATPRRRCRDRGSMLKRPIAVRVPRAREPPG